jgi:hypothetical protein
MMLWRRYNWRLSNYIMKYKLFVCVNGNKSLIASTYEFSVLDKLIAELDKFGTKWEVTEYGVTVLNNFE